MATTLSSARTDEQIQRDVLAEMKWDARVRPNEIGVTVKDGVVALIGAVDTYAKRSAAEEAAHRVKGVQAVANDIEVRLPSAVERTDADLAAAAVRALAWDAYVPLDQIDVTVSKGWVTLRGDVDWQYQKQDAERIIRRLAGVRGVTNIIAIRPSLVPSEIKDEIEDALVRSAETDAERINVEVHGNRITLKGTVRSSAERQEAERIAWSAPGVAAVDNRIAVSF